MNLSDFAFYYLLPCVVMCFVHVHSRECRHFCHQRAILSVQKQESNNSGHKGNTVAVFQHLLHSRSSPQKHMNPCNCLSYTILFELYGSDSLISETHKDRMRRKKKRNICPFCLENRIHVTVKQNRNKHKHSNTHYTYGMWMLCKTHCVSASGLSQSRHDNQGPGPLLLNPSAYKDRNGEFLPFLPATDVHILTHKHMCIYILCAHCSWSLLLLSLFSF